MVLFWRFQHVFVESKPWLLLNKREAGCSFCSIDLLVTDVDSIVTVTIFSQGSADFFVLLCIIILISLPSSISLWFLKLSCLLLQGKRRDTWCPGNLPQEVFREVIFSSYCNCIWLAYMHHSWIVHCFFLHTLITAKMNLVVSFILSVLFPMQPCWGVRSFLNNCVCKYLIFWAI